MSKRSWAACLLLPVACSSAPLVQGTGSEHARRTLQQMVQQKELPGAQYLAVTAQGTLLELHLGRADAAAERPLERDTLQMAYSITKVVTAIAVLQLAGAGKLGLDRPLSDYFAEHTYGPRVTLAMLLAHTAGVPNPMPLDWFALEGEPLERAARLRAVLAGNPRLEAQPGEKYRYSNVGYWLLEKAIEAASGQDYADYVGEHIFAALGIPRAEVSFELPPAPSAAVGHSRRTSWMNPVLWAMTPSRYWAEPADGWSRSERLLPHGRAYGGLFCSAAALAPLLQDLMKPTPRLLSPALRDQMFAEQHTNQGQGTAATLGWVRGELEGVAYVGKQGGGFGFHGNLRVYRSLGLATVFLANRTEISPGPIDERSDTLDRGFVRELATARNR